MTARKKIALTVVFVLLSVVVFLFFLFIRMVKVPTGGMQNTILAGDHILVNRFAREVKRGDLIIFKFPMDPSVQYIKRIIGLPGETIEIRDTKIFINGRELAEKRVMVDQNASINFPGRPLKEIASEGRGSYSVYYYSDRSFSEFSNDFTKFATKEPFQIPAGEYFVLGDNRDDSQDSRYWGTVPQALVTGKAWLVYWSNEEDPIKGNRTRWNRLFTKLK
jgi:signal peptidase I